MSQVAVLDINGPDAIIPDVVKAVAAVLARPALYAALFELGSPPIGLIDSIIGPAR